MIRREFITLVGGAASAWPLAQQFQTLPTIGFLGASTSLNWAHRTTAFVRRLGEDQLGLLLAVKNPSNGRHRARLHHRRIVGSKRPELGRVLQ